MGKGETKKQELHIFLLINFSFLFLFQWGHWNILLLQFFPFFSGTGKILKRIRIIVVSSNKLKSDTKLPKY